MSWIDANQHYLSGALAELRARLGKETADVVPEPARGERPFPLDVLVPAFRLSPFERDVLLLCAGIELDAFFAKWCADAHGHPDRAYATFGLALGALPDAHWSALTPGGPLRRWHLVELVRGESVTQSPIRIDERVLHYLTGIDVPDERLAGIVERSPADAELVPSHASAASRGAAWWAAASRSGSALPHIQLCGGDAQTRRAIAAAIARANGMSLASVSAHALPGAPADVALLARLCEREAVLTGTVLFLECNGLDESPRPEPIRQFIDESSAPLIAGTRERRALSASHSMRAIDVSAAGAGERRDQWDLALGNRTSELNGQLDALSWHFHLAPAAIRETVEEALGHEDLPLRDALWRTCRARTRPRLDELARRMEARASWDDLVLPPLQLHILHEIADSVRYRATVYERWGFAKRDTRGLGVSVLFHGASGTGKTLAAEVLAHELELDFYRIDLSGIVSKYIGETEKNLRRIFEAAEDGGAVLIFDEADALFGKRSEVRDSHDRYANIEVSYLLQRIEAYRGIAILTTNLRDALDTAFLRRLRYVVQFPFPDATQRAQIWQRTFPPELPLSGIDIDRLSALSITGGNIRNVALSAAFLAARAGQSVRMSHLAHAARAEYTKLERTLPEAEVAGWQ